MITDPWHKFLIKHRPHCDRCEVLTKATTVRKFNGKDLVLCDEHAMRLDAVRISELKQEATRKTNDKHQHSTH